MIIPKTEAEVKKFEKLVEQNDQAGDWVGVDPTFSPLSPTPLGTILEKVGDRKVPTK